MTGIHPVPTGCAMGIGRIGKGNGLVVVAGSAWVMRYPSWFGLGPRRCFEPPSRAAFGGRLAAAQIGKRCRFELRSPPSVLLAGGDEDFDPHVHLAVALEAQVADSLRLHPLLL